MRFALLAAVLVPLAATAVVAQTNVIKDRQAIMKDIGDQTKVAGAMVKGEAPYDAAKAAAIFKTYTDGAAKFGALFTEGSNVGETKAAPAIWSDRAGFDAALAKFKADVAANVDKVGTEAGFKAAMAAVGEDCAACHRAYKLR
ncbi:c-type cytochrome [Azorhizobium doebereinerae]|uniref:c-type cytochrome n=1 Tax=Azorhizobium doebereinerae TaxID=281091 RepID=UPI0004125912|nr:cytochrome c [Azorhizobium doebereinerae]